MSAQLNVFGPEELAKSASGRDLVNAYQIPKELPDLSREKLICIDVETKDPGIEAGLGVGTRRGGFVAGVAVGVPGKQWYFPIRHATGLNMDPDNVLRWCRDQFKYARQDKLFTNAMYDLDYLAHEDVAVKGSYLDIQVAEPLLNENRYSYALGELAKDYLGQTKDETGLYQWCAEVFGGKPTRKQQAGNIWKAHPAIVSPYAMSDVSLPIDIFAKQKQRLKDEGLETIFAIETGIIPMLLAMRRRGVRFDVDKAQETNHYMRAEVEAIEAQLAVLSGGTVDIWAAQTIAEFFNVLGISYPKLASGAPTFTADWLKNSDNKIANLIYEARRWDKAQGTFIEGLLKYQIEGRIYAEFNQLRKDDAGAVSGRFSSSNPNLQNQPSRDPEMLSLVRSLFIPEEGCRMVALDYSQVEFRVLTHYGFGESAETARGMYRDDPNTDFHDMVSKLTGMERKAAKNVTFALAYGAGVKKMASMVGCSYDEAKRMFDVYHKRLPFLKDLSDLAGSTAQRRGFIKTLLGRRRRFDKWEPRDFDLAKTVPACPRPEAIEKWGGHGIKRSKTHTALNAVSQGTAADIAKKAMLDIWESGVCDVVGVPHMLVHDEMVFSVPYGKEGDEAIAEVKNLMENTVKFSVPLRVGVSEGTDWGQCK